MMEQAKTEAASIFCLRADQFDLHVEVAGNAHGIPVLWFHGGWGPDAEQTSWMDLKRYRLISFHQRGWGKSLPTDFENNTPAETLQDAEAIRTHLGIDKWAVAGWSNGAFHAFAYATHYSKHVFGLSLWGMWLIRPCDLAWNYNSSLRGKCNFFPKEWDAFAAEVGYAHGGPGPQAANEHNLVGPYWSVLSSTGTDSEAVKAKKSAFAWMQWDACGATMQPLPPVDDPDVAVRTAKLGLHLYRNAGDFGERCLSMARAGALQSIPLRIVVGQYDMLCPPFFAHEIAEACGQPGCVRVVDASAHCAESPSFIDTLQKALQDVTDVASIQKLLDSDVSGPAGKKQEQ